ncbi:MAG: ribose 5-phosphate isomerase B [Phycisphaerales bacterium]
MRIAISADHRGLNASRQLVEKLKRDGHEVQIVGDIAGPIDYPEPAYRVAQAVAGAKADLGLLICGTGVGMSIAANKVKGVRAAVVHDEFTAQISRSHNNANVLCLSADLLGQKLIEKIVEVWLTTPFEGGRHARRVNKIKAIEEGKDPSGVVE